MQVHNINISNTIHRKVYDISIPDVPAEPLPWLLLQKREQFTNPISNTNPNPDLTSLASYYVKVIAALGGKISRGTSRWKCYSGSHAYNSVTCPRASYRLTLFPASPGSPGKPGRPSGPSTPGLPFSPFIPINPVRPLSPSSPF